MITPTMRQFITFFVILASAFAYSVENDVYPTIEPYIFEDIINQTIEALRPYVPDPFLIDNIGINLPNNTFIVGNGSISNLKISGWQGFQVPALNFAIIGMWLNFTFVLPVIDFYTDYRGNFSVLDTVALWGDGNARVHVDNGEIQGSAQLNLTGGISVENLRIQLYVRNTTFELHGLLDDEDLCSVISSVLNDCAAKLFDEYQAAISDIISPLWKEIINFVLDAIRDITTTTAPPFFEATQGLD